MKPVRRVPKTPLVQLRVADLVRTSPQSDHQRQSNLKVPADVLQRAHQLARRLGVTKSATVVALLNEGLQHAYGRGLGTRAAPKR